MAPNIAFFHYPCLVLSREKWFNRFDLDFPLFWGLLLDSKKKVGDSTALGWLSLTHDQGRSQSMKKKHWVWMLKPLTKSEGRGRNKSKNSLSHPRFRFFFLNICLLIPTTDLCNNCHYSHSSPLRSHGIVPHLSMLFHHCSPYVPFLLLNYLPWPYGYPLLFILSFTWQTPVYHSDSWLDVIWFLHPLCLG